MRKATRYLSILALAIVSGCSDPSGIESQTPDVGTSQQVELILNSWVGWGPLFIARENGYFDDVDVSLTFIEDAGSRRAAMISKQVDGYASSVDNLAIDATFGVSGKIVLSFDESAGGDGIIVRDGVTWENISDSKIAVQRGLPGHFLLLSLLKQHGISIDTIDILDMDAESAGSGFVAGSIDVAVSWEPWLSKAQSLSNGNVLATTKDTAGLIVDTLVINNESLAAKPEAIKKIVDAWFEALAWYESNPLPGHEIIANAYGIPPEDVEAMLLGIKFYDKETNQKYMTGSSPQIHEVFGSACQLWYEAGETSQVLQAEDYVDASYL